MKHKNLFVPVLCLAILSCFSSCTTEEPVPTTGGLIVKVQLVGSTGFLSDVLVRIATSKDDLEGAPLQSTKTGSNGQVDFGQLAPGTYYYDASHTLGGVEYYGVGQVQVIAGQLLELTLPLILEESEPEESEPTTGGLIIKVQLEGSTGFLSGVLVALATSEDNLEDAPLQDTETGSNGQVDFGQLAPGNYYYDAHHIIGNVEYYGVGQVQVTAGQLFELTLTLEEPEPTTGGLIIKVQLEGSTGFLSGVLVTLATSVDNLEDAPLQDTETGSNGQVDFGQLAPGNYYYDAHHIIGNVEYYGVGQVQVTAGQLFELTLTLEEPEPTTGGLIIKVQLEGSTGFLSGVLVTLATSVDNLEDAPLQDIETGSNGQADFGQLLPGNYYYDAFHTIGSDDYYGVGQVQIIAGQLLELTLTIEN